MGRQALEADSDSVPNLELSSVLGSVQTLGLNAFPFPAPAVVQPAVQKTEPGHKTVHAAERASEADSQIAESYAAVRSERVAVQVRATQGGSPILSDLAPVAAAVATEPQDTGPAAVKDKAIAKPHTRVRGKQARASRERRSTAPGIAYPTRGAYRGQLALSAAADNFGPAAMVAPPVLEPFVAKDSEPNSHWLPLGKVPHTAADWMPRVAEARKIPDSSAEPRPGPCSIPSSGLVFVLDLFPTQNPSRSLASGQAPAHTLDWARQTKENTRSGKPQPEVVASPVAEPPAAAPPALPVQPVARPLPDAQFQPGARLQPVAPLPQPQQPASRQSAPLPDEPALLPLRAGVALPPLPPRRADVPLLSPGLAKRKSRDTWLHADWPTSTALPRPRASRSGRLAISNRSSFHLQLSARFCLPPDYAPVLLSPHARRKETKSETIRI